MNKKRISTFIIISFFFVLISTGQIYAQQVFYFGLQGGVGLNLPDVELNAIDTFEYKYGIYEYIKALNEYKGSTVNFYRESFLPISDTAGDGFVNINLSPGVVASLYFGYEGNKYFGVRTGADLHYGVNDLFKFAFIAELTGVYNSAKYPDVIPPPARHTIMTGSINYVYSFINIPLLATIHFVNKKVFRLGFALGPYLSIPLGDIEATYQVESAIERKPIAHMIKQDLGAGIQIEILTELKIGKKGAITLNIGYSREFLKFFDSMILNPELMSQSTITIPRYDMDADKRFDDVKERKLTVFQGVKATLGYKFNIQISGPPGTGTAVADPNANYFMIIGSQVEGPLKITDIQKLCNASVIKSDSMMWKTGMDDWKNAGTFQELAPYLK
jgi:hypothetical protein